jgi:hypothetical protein
MLKSGFLAWNSGYCHSKGFLFLHLTANISEKSAITVNRSEEQSPAPSNDRPPANMDQQTILKAKELPICSCWKQLKPLHKSGLAGAKRSIS